MSQFFGTNAHQFAGALIPWPSESALIASRQVYPRMPDARSGANVGDGFPQLFRWFFRQNRGLQLVRLFCFIEEPERASAKMARVKCEVYRRFRLSAVRPEVASSQAGRA